MAKLGSLQNLRSLTFSFSSEAYAVNFYKGAKMLEELKNLDQLEVLKLRITRDYPCSMTNSNSLPVLKRVFQQLKKLKEVDMYTTDYDDSLVVVLAENNPNLKVLCLRNYLRVTQDLVERLRKEHPSLDLRLDFY